MIDRDILEALRDWGLDTDTIEYLRVYAELVERAPINLTAFSPREFWRKGVLDALSWLPLIDANEPNDAISAVDIGSGSGLPGMVLAIVRPRWLWTLVDSRNKRVDFLRGVVERLGLTNVSVVCERAEMWPRVDPTALAEFDVVTARAVARVMIAIELTVPLARLGGTVIIPLGESGYQELERNGAFVGRLGGAVQPLDRPWVARIRKVSSTPTEFPRQGSKLGRL